MRNFAIDVDPKTLKLVPTQAVSLVWKNSVSNPDALNPTLTDQPFFFSTSTMPIAGNTSLGDIPQNGSVNPLSAEHATAHLVDQARREIAEIIREIASLARKPIDRNVFFATLLDRIVCAIAANGAVLWRCSDDDAEPLIRTGKITDQSIKPFGQATHLRLIREIAANQSPAVVPPTPDASDPNLPCNPTDVAVAVVPVLDLTSIDQGNDAGSPRYVVEVFLEPEAGLATQRGYLRFVTQMADLASEFLRADELRASRRRENLQLQVTLALLQIHRLQTSSAVAAHIVDSCAEIFDCTRASLARMRGGVAKLVAVSHVESIDHRGAACRNLQTQIQSIVFPTNASMLSGDAVSVPNTATGATDDAELTTIAVVRDSQDCFRLYLQSKVPNSLDTTTGEALSNWANQSLAVLLDRLRLESIPFAKAYLSIAPSALSLGPTRIRRTVALIGATAATLLIANIPTPMAITVPASLRPSDTRIYYAPTDAIITSMDVKHGQSVTQGEILLRLRDWSLEEQITTVQARRSVVSQQLQRSIALLVEAPAAVTYAKTNRPSGNDEDLVQQQRLLEEELDGLDQQLELLLSSRDRLLIKAERDGVVDAWDAELTAEGRPVRRGDTLLRIEPIDARWMVDAEVDQSRVSLVLDRLASDAHTEMKVATLARPETMFNAKFIRRSVALNERSPNDANSSALGIELLVDHKTSQDEATDWTYGAPATVTIDCGKRPLVEVVFYDLVRAITRTWARWI